MRTPRRFDRFTIITAAGRRGPAHARNAGARVATGDLLCFCDADDEIEPGWIAALVAAAADHDFVVGRLDVDTINSPRCPRVPPRPIPALGNAPPFACSGNMAIWAAVFGRSGGFDEDLRANEDVELSDRLLADGATLGWAPDAVVHYRLRSSLRGIGRQSFRSAWGAARVRHGRGEPVLDSIATVARRTAWLVSRLPSLVVADRRGRWVHVAGGLAGELTAAAWLVPSSWWARDRSSRTATASGTGRASGTRTANGSPTATGTDGRR